MPRRRPGRRAASTGFGNTDCCLSSQASVLGAQGEKDGGSWLQNMCCFCHTFILSEVRVISWMELGCRQG